ncbi:DUF2163 domain-containing protein [Phaeovulum sp.]|uniref:DUF2163 domain-containing protein n=1 Tax=Phaeovulum sp. TaxID=2934796 RepID=UPI00272F0356|nr:DUF2163 domain-containing protein [Phaeovulum sp.]MDP1669382.1 DUF2163 domain-containing protein [Phaeovulum sp.]MDZ4119652.1 DUF2163 domain-containing protein [Phaeovulum sp.]
MGYPEELKAHLASGATTICRAWAVTRSDGVVLGFTDHDRAMRFDGIDFMPNTGMTAKALVQSTGLAVDNTEAVGALSSEAIREADIMAGRYDGAEVRVWQVNWADVSQRALRFRGHLGEITRGESAFGAELRGLTEALSGAAGTVYQAGCAAILGDARCGVDLKTPGYFVELAVQEIDAARVFGFAELGSFADHWFEKGRLRVLSGAAVGLVGVVKNDRLREGGARRVELWQQLRAEIATGDLIRLEAGCDRRLETCRIKFSNVLNFRGFPHIPGEDWLSAYPRQAEANDGGSMWR